MSWRLLFEYAVYCFVAWLSWRVWRFTVRPLLKPELPRELPYLLPWIGSAISFFRDSGSTIYSGIRDKRRSIFALKLAGETIYVVTNPKDVSVIYKNTTTLAFDAFIGDLMLQCGATAKTVQRMCQEPPPYPLGKSTTGLNPMNKSLVKLAIDFHHQQLLPGPDSHEQEITRSFVETIKGLLRWDQITQNVPLAPLPGTGFETSLLGFCGNVLIEAGARTYWGCRLWEQDPESLSSFYALDKGMWKILFQYPRCFSQEVIKTRDHIAAVIARYYEIPRRQRQDAAWFTKAMETESRAAGLDEREMAACVMIIYFVINGNTYKLCFWALGHILADSDLLAAIRAEIAGVAGDAEPSIQHLTQRCPLLDSTLREVLRVYTSSASMRLVLADTAINGKVLLRGHKVMIPYRQLHENPAVWGPDADSFDPRRFMENRALLREASYRPFGGGATLCAGRFVAMAEVVSFIGTALYRYDLALSRPQPAFPKADTMKPTFGMMAPREGEDLTVLISRRIIPGIPPRPCGPEWE
ncbi:hypothetical protein QQS21_003274 [Conoideocrella luteorostrata]|uniref:Cytochrome P450 n=1 Tax=Conoideocrella luteorostrata TaxID=1105319 RepID=A0AAJ0CWN7_9HYPO|nr:hypothetical protein QQS21_003274 [Conoideocrella luteorostrata]